MANSGSAPGPSNSSPSVPGPSNSSPSAFLTSLLKKIRLKKQNETSEEMINSLRESDEHNYKSFKIRRKKKEEENWSLLAALNKYFQKKQSVSSEENRLPTDSSLNGNPVIINGDNNEINGENHSNGLKKKQYLSTSRNKPLRDIYMAKSLDQLNEKAREKLADTKNANHSIKVKSAMKLFDAARLSYTDGDQERSYVLYYRYIEVFTSIKKSPDYHKDKVYVDSMLGDKVREALKACEELANSLENRYKLLKESEDLRAKQIVANNDNTSLESTANDLVKRKRSDAEDDKNYQTIDAISLLDCIENSRQLSEILMIDVRTTNHFNESHIDKLKTFSAATIINISKDKLSPGMTTYQLKQLLPLGETLDAFQRRRTMSKIVIIDYNSDELINGSPAYYLAETLWKWDQTPLKTKSKPLLLKGGYQSWISTYPMYSSDAVL